MNYRNASALALVFTLGVTAGAVARKGIAPGTYRGKEPKEAARALLDVAKKQAGDGSWENIAIGRVYYLSGMKNEGQAMFDRVVSGRKAEASDFLRVGRIYMEAGEWEKAKPMFAQALKKSPKDAPWLSEIGAFYNLHDDRATAETMFDRSYAIESEEVWATVNMAGSYVGVKPVH